MAYDAIKITSFVFEFAWMIMKQWFEVEIEVRLESSSQRFLIIQDIPCDFGKDRRTYTRGFSMLKFIVCKQNFFVCTCNCAYLFNYALPAQRYIFLVKPKTARQRRSQCRFLRALPGCLRALKINYLSTLVMRIRPLCIPPYRTQRKNL